MYAQGRAGLKVQIIGGLLFVNSFLCHNQICRLYPINIFLFPRVTGSPATYSLAIPWFHEGIRCSMHPCQCRAVSRARRHHSVWVAVGLLPVPCVFERFGFPLPADQANIEHCTELRRLSKQRCAIPLIGGDRLMTPAPYQFYSLPSLSPSS